jgi:hypothetical protein
MRFALLDEGPASEREEFSFLAHRADLVCKYLFELCEQSLLAEPLVGNVIDEVGLSQVFLIEQIILIQLDNPLDERFFVRKIIVVQKAFRVELLLDAWIAPINWQSPSAHGFDDFFSGIPSEGSVLERDVELVRLEKFDLGNRSVGNRRANIVEDSPGGIDFPIFREALEEIDSLSSLGIADDKTAEFGFSSDDFCRVFLFLEQLRQSPPNIERQPKMAGVIQVVASEGVVALSEIGQIGFDPHINFNAIVDPVDMAERISIDQEIRLIAELHLEMALEEVIEKVVGFLVAGPEVREIEAHFSHRALKIRIVLRGAVGKARRESSQGHCLWGGIA